eukprot:scaffold33672_cov153-Skeletonema_dohrnii-CCMP3373.AAC.2
MKRTMRITVTFADSIRVAMMLLAPQLVLQIINLSVPNVRMQSIELTEGFHVCESGAGVIILIVGIVLAAIPFFVALLINIRSEGIPDRFRELKDILKSTSTSFCVLIITLPTAGMIRMMVPAAHAYLLSASVLSFVLPLSYNIAQTRANVIKSTGIAKGSARSVVKKRKKVTRPVSSSSSSHEEEDNLLILEAAEEAATMGKMFDAMGSKSKAVDINEDILTLFKVEDDFSWEVGFTLSEVHSLGPKSLEIVVTTLIASSKLFWAMFRSNPENGEQAKTRTFKSCMDALDIFDKAPAKKQLRDHSIVFPGYSFMNEIAKAMPYKPPNNLPQDEFEKGLADNFLRATNHQQYHHCIALAMQADVMRRQGKHEEAIVVIEEMKSIYDPGLHSRAILKEYVKDHCCETVAVITNWLSQDGRIEEAMKLCDDVIEALPEMKGTAAVQSKYFALLPICRVMTEQGQAKKALDLYRDTVEEPAAKGGRKMYPLVVATSPAIMITLNCASSEGGEPYADSKSDTAFMLNGERKYPVFFDYIGIIYFDMAFATLYAEACVCLASIHGHGCCSQDKKALIKECEQYLEASEEALKNKDGKLLSTVAHSYHSKIARKLQMLQYPSTTVQTLEKAGSDQAEDFYDCVQMCIDKSYPKTAGTMRKAFGSIYFERRPNFALVIGSPEYRVVQWRSAQES